MRKKVAGAAETFQIALQKCIAAQQKKKKNEKGILISVISGCILGEKN